MLVSFLIFLAFAVFLQWRSGAFIAEFGGSDEAAHFVTSLMVRDYVASGMPAGPVKFAENYYVHYPKVTFGIWPPLFHFTQAAWTLVFTPSRGSVLVLMAMWSALLATGCFAALRKEFGFVVAFVLGLVLVSLPDTQASASTDMPDVMMSCFMFGATLAYARYLDLQQRRDALLFGLLAGLSILVKYNALCLALLPPFALLLNRRFDLMRRLSFWLPMAVVAALCGPWYLYNRGLVKYAMEPTPGLPEIPGALSWNSLAMIRMIGAPLFVLAVVGAISQFRPTVLRGKGQGTWVSATALLLATWIFHCFLYPSQLNRYLLAALPVLMMFVAAGCRTIANWLGQAANIRWVPARTVLLGACALYALVTFHVPEKKHYGIPSVAQHLLNDAADHEQLVLVSGRAETEGMVVSEMALADRKLRSCVLRGSKVLARSTWMGENYELQYHSPEEIARFLHKIPVSVVVADRLSEFNKPHHRMLTAALESDPATWAPVNLGNSDLIQVYRRNGPLPVVSSPSVLVDLSRTLGRSLAVPQVKSPTQVP